MTKLADGSMTRTVTPFASLAWQSLPQERTRGALDGEGFVRSATAPDGHRVQQLRFNGVANPHFHLKTNSFYMFEGRMELRDREVLPGMWGLEPVGAIHPATTFYDAIYGFGMSPGSGGGGAIMLKPGETVPDFLVKVGFEEDLLTDLVDANRLDWAPTAVDGISIKLLHVFDDSSAFAALYRARAGAALPARTYVGPTDVYVLSGSATFADGVAQAGDWVYFPAGVRESEVTFADATEWLQSSYGPVLDLDADGSIAGLTDGFTLRARGT